MGFPDEIRRLLNSAGVDDEVQLDAASIQTLASGLRGLAARQRGWITFEDYRRLFEINETSADGPTWPGETRPPRPSSWTAYSWNFPRTSEWTWNSRSALALAALANRRHCAPTRVPNQSRFYFTKEEPHET